MVRSGYVCSSSTYVGMITVDRAKQEVKARFDMVTREVGRDRLVRAEQEEKALLDMVTREVGRDRLVSFRLSRRESYKRRREEKSTTRTSL